MKRMNENADYNSIVEAGLILPHKAKYTRRDFRRLCKEWEQIDARFIILCSAAYWRRHGYPVHIAQAMETQRFLDLCLTGLAAM